MCPDISKIKLFARQNYHRLQERIYTILDMHGVTVALIDQKLAKTDPKQVEHGHTPIRLICRHTIISTLSDELFDVYCSYKEAKEIWENLNDKYTAEDAGK